MTNFSPYANYGYLALIKETTPWAAVKPTNYIRYINEWIETNFWISNVQEIAWSRERNIRSVPNQIESSWTIEFYTDSKNIWHFLRWLFWAPTSQTITASTSYRHIFTVTDTPKTYTLDIKSADAPWVHRYIWVQFTSLEFTWDDNKIKCTVWVTPRKAFINARVTTSASSWTTLLVDQTTWLTTSDTISILQNENGYTNVADLTITSVDSDTQLTVSTIWTTIDVWDLVVIKKSTPSYVDDKVFTWLWWWQVYTWDDIDNTTTDNKESFTLTYNNEVEARYFWGVEESSRYAWDVITKWYTATWQISKFYDSESNIDRLRKNEKFWLRLFLQWETALESNSAIKASSVWWSWNGFKVEASTAGKAWNDINVTLVIASDDNLAVSKSWNNVIVSLANTTASKNTWTLIASIINALSWVDATAEGTGTEQFTSAIDNQNLWSYIWQTNVVWRDASEKPYLQFDHSCAKIDPYFPWWSEDDILMEEIPLTFYKDVETATIPKKWSTKIYLYNSISSY